MENIKKLFLGGLFLFILFQCNNTTTEEGLTNTVNVDINKKETFYLDSIADFGGIVPLEVTDESYIKEINQVYLVDSFIVVWDSPMSNILIFNDKGRYLYNLGSKGRGPEEYLSFESVYVDYNKRHISLMDNSKLSVITYDIFGNFISEDEVPYYAYAFYPDKKGYWMLDYGQNPLKDNLILVDCESKDIIQSFMGTNDNLIVMSSNNFFEDELGNVLFHFPYLNTIYTLEEDGLKPFLRVDFGKLQNPYTDMKSSNFHDVIKSNNYVGGIHNLYKYEDHLFFSFYKYHGSSNNIDSYNVHISLLDNKVSVFDFNLRHTSELPVSPLPTIIGLSDGKLIYQIDPNILDEALIDKLKDSDLMRDAGVSAITAEYNPILVIYDMK